MIKKKSTPSLAFIPCKYIPPIFSRNCWCLTMFCPNFKVDWTF